MLLSLTDGDQRPNNQDDSCCTEGVVGVVRKQLNVKAEEDDDDDNWSTVATLGVVSKVVEQDDNDWI